jgi:hypothetical protein
MILSLRRLVRRLTVTPTDQPLVHRPTVARLRRYAFLSVLFLPVLLGVAPVCQVDEARERYAVEIEMEGQAWDEYSLIPILDALSRLPDHVVNRLGSRFYGRLHILSNPDGVTLSGYAPYSQGGNFYSNNDGPNEVVLLPNQGTLTVLHELGHAYQMRLVPPGRYAWVLFQEEMRDFMRATGWRLLSSDEEVAAAHDQTELQFAYDGPKVWNYLSRDDPIEDYANSFALFFYDPEALRQLSPERYDWFALNVATDAR